MAVVSAATAATAAAVAEPAERAGGPVPGSMAVGRGRRHSITVAAEASADVAAAVVTVSGGKDPTSGRRDR